MKLTALAVVILALGIVLGLAFRGMVFDAEAAKPPPPRPEGRLIDLGTLSVGAQANVLSPIVDTGDCGEIAIMAMAPHVSGVGVLNAYASPDGSTRIRAPIISPSLSGELDSKSTTGGLIVGQWPFVQAEFHNPAAFATDITAWIWCAP